MTRDLWVEVWMKAGKASKENDIGIGMENRQSITRLALIVPIPEDNMNE